MGEDYASMGCGSCGERYGVNDVCEKCGGERDEDARHNDYRMEGQLVCSECFDATCNRCGIYCTNMEMHPSAGKRRVCCNCRGEDDDNKCKSCMKRYGAPRKHGGISDKRRAWLMERGYTTDPKTGRALGITGKVGSKEKHEQAYLEKTHQEPHLLGPPRRDIGEPSFANFFDKFGAPPLSKGMIIGGLLFSGPFVYALWKTMGGK